ncbi:MAG: TIGR03088 family PEP-CTERM/XrtA system glycosyltransferase [Rubrivivax sp.]|nr:TIGR03088 family PEP-CTERM/XrtA system glycosyltransferase [Rubrivivax sp.]
MGKPFDSGAARGNPGGTADVLAPGAAATPGATLQAVRAAQADLRPRAPAAPPPLVCHIVYRFDTGGLENGLVNLINHMPRATARHMVVALTEVAEGFAARVRRRDVEFVSLHKPPGHGLRLYPPLVKLLRRCRPAVVHTRNLAALEMQPAAAWAGVPLRVHGEHGRDAEDIDGTSRRHQWMRRAYAPFVHRYVALSRDLAGYLTERVGIDGRRVAQVYNGVDTLRFRPAQPVGSDAGHAAVARREPVAGSPFNDPGLWVAGTVGRMMTVKAQPDLAQAFVRALRQAPALRARLRLVMVGEGSLREQARHILHEAGVAELAWLPGERHDVPELMRGFDAFVLPSHAEGISNTILEAMASGLPVLATSVGGNPELVSGGSTGVLVPAGDIDALAATLIQWCQRPDAARALGQVGRERVCVRFSLKSMIDGYTAVYRGA